MSRDALPRLLRAWLLTALIDGLFSSVLSAFFYGSTVARLWQGVAAVLLGPSALQGGSTSVLIGLAMHLTTALAWSTLFLLLYENVPAIRRTVASPNGVLKVASAYGPCIWLAMSLVVIPLLAHRPPAFTIRWLIQLVGHIFFVAVPMVWAIGRGGREA